MTIFKLLALSSGDGLSPPNLVNLSQLAILGAVVYLAGSVTYNIFFHPLSSYPGPKYAVASTAWWLAHSLQGDLIHQTKALHDIYGDTVRIGPNQLSYVKPEALKDIYGQRAGHSENLKDPKMALVRGTDTARAINSASAARHAYLRKLLSPMFSLGAVNKLEPTLQGEINAFIEHLEDECRIGETCIDLFFRVNTATFSLMGRLVFGESFSFMDSTTLDRWIESLFQFTRVLSLIRVLNNIPLLCNIPREIFVPPSLKKKFKVNVRLAKDMVQRQKASPISDGNLMSLFFRGLEERNLTELEVCINAEFFVIAGSETTATVLSGALYLLLSHPASWTKLCHEIRSAFSSSDEITLTRVMKLKYMLAVLNESLRIYPPATDSPVRLTPPEGAMINGTYIPGNTKVGINPYAAQRSFRNFSYPDCFIPERWTGETKYQNDRRDALHPFSYGSRDCIGRNFAHAQLRLLLAKLVYTFDMKLEKESQDWMTQRVFVIWEKKPLSIRISPRKKHD